MSVSLVRSGANSATFIVRLASLPRAITLSDWEQLPKGRLRDLVTASYPTIGPVSSNESFLTAFAEEGGAVSAITSGVAIGVPTNWSIAGSDNSPVLGIPDMVLADETTVWEKIGPNPIAVTISLAYSASE